MYIILYNYIIYSHVSSILHTSKQVTSRSHTAPVPHGWHWHRPEGAQEMGEFTDADTDFLTHETLETLETLEYQTWKIRRLNCQKGDEWLRQITFQPHFVEFSLKTWKDEIQDEHEKQTKYDEKQTKFMKRILPRNSLTVHTEAVMGAAVHQLPSTTPVGCGLHL